MPHAAKVWGMSYPLHERIILMDKYIVTNYSMGRPVEQKEVEASSADAATRKADALGFAPLGLPGTVKGAGSKSRVLGIRRA